MHIEAIKEVLAQAMNNYVKFSNNINSCTTKLPKNKALKLYLYTLLCGP